MSIVFFLHDPVFWTVLSVLESFWLIGFFSAWRNQMATPIQMIRKSIQHGIPWTGHFGFWFLFFVLHPVLAWATARMWPLWSERPWMIITCLFLGIVVGIILQSLWSHAAGSADAWSKDGWPNITGIIHIAHMGPEVGIMLMVLASWWYGQMPDAMFLGLLAFTLCHFLIGGTHWPIRMKEHRAPWVPESLPELNLIQSVVLSMGSGFLFLCGIILITAR